MAHCYPPPLFVVLCVNDSAALKEECSVGFILTTACEEKG